MALEEGQAAKASLIEAGKSVGNFALKVATVVSLTAMFCSGAAVAAPGSGFFEANWAGLKENGSEIIDGLKPAAAALTNSLSSAASALQTIAPAAPAVAPAMP